MKSAPLDQGTLDRWADHIRFELRASVLSGTVSAAVTLDHLFTQLCGPERSREDRLRFMLYAAPIARRVAFSVAPKDEHIANVRISTILEWFGWIDMFDPTLGTVLDLHYFAGLSAKDTAFALQLPGRTVVGNLKLARDWWLRFNATHN